MFKLIDRARTRFPSDRMVMFTSSRCEDNPLTEGVVPESNVLDHLNSRRRIIWCGAIVFQSFCAAAFSQKSEPVFDEPDPRLQQASQSSAIEPTTDRSGLADSAGLRARLIDAPPWLDGSVIVTAPGDSTCNETQAQTAAGEATLAYSSTRGTLLLTPGPKIAYIADDVNLLITDGCILDHINVLVGGGGDGTGPGFSIEYALLPVCPSTSSLLIPGSNGVVELPDDGTHLVTIDYSDADIRVGSNFWVQLSFDSPDAGWYVGTPPTIGWSEELLDAPNFHCRATLGDPEIYESFYLEVYVNPECTPDFFFGYHAPRSFEILTARLGSAAEDIELVTESCDALQLEMEVMVNGNGSCRFELRYDSAQHLPGELIDGSSFEFVADYDQPATAPVRVTFDPPLSIPQKFWLVYDCSYFYVTPLSSGSAPTIGSSDSTGAFFTDETWRRATMTGSSIAVSILCDGQAMNGACCDVLHGRPECLPDVARANCDAIPGRWADGEACSFDAFDPPCGVSACCHNDQTCEDLPQDTCNAQGGPLDQFWVVRGTCGDLQCGYFACRISEGSCASAKGGAGCRRTTCCNRVCEFDPSCCERSWDDQCVKEAIILCQLTPIGDECDDAQELNANDTVVVGNVFASAASSDPGFRCHPNGVNASSFGTVWFRFVATETTARITAWAVDGAAGDSLIGVYSTLPSDPCGTMIPIACNDGANSNGIHESLSTLCLGGLTPGNEYYIVLASKTAADQGIYRLVIQPTCEDDHQVNDLVHGASLQADVVHNRDQEWSEKGLEDNTPASRSSAMVPTIMLDGSPVGDLNVQHREVEDHSPAPKQSGPRSEPVTDHGPWIRGRFTSVQVNVDHEGHNIPGDAANEPSLAVDPKDPDKIVIGWRQFDTTLSDFRQAGSGYSHDAGATWTFPGVLEPGIFRSDPVLAVDSSGVFYYYSLRGSSYSCDVFRSLDGGVTWDEGVYAFGGDKPWVTVDRRPNFDNFYATWGFTNGAVGLFSRSTDRGATFSDEMDLPGRPRLGSLDVDVDGSLYVAGYGGIGHIIVRSDDAQRANEVPTFGHPVTVNLGYHSSGFNYVSGNSPNPGGILGQVWVATDHSNGSTRGNIYVLASVHPTGTTDPRDVMFSRSVDGGLTWSSAISVNDDSGNEAWQWFGTMSVAPNGRIDVVWNDTRNSGKPWLSELYYTYSFDGGRTWSQNVPVSPMFDTWIGWPWGQRKIGDYYHSVSDNRGMNVAYAATFNGEQDIYFLRIEPVVDCNTNGLSDQVDIDEGRADDCNQNIIPDVCERDFDNDGLIDGCDSDLDGDGVPNSRDSCRLTPLGSIVDESGIGIQDSDRDCDLDLRDYKMQAECLTRGGPGPGVSSIECSHGFDTNQDDRIDLLDVAGFLDRFTGRR